MKLLLSGILFFSLMVVLAVTTAAQDDLPDWTIWFMEADQTISEVNLNGEALRTITLTTTTDIYGVTVSPSGTHIAYITVEENEDAISGLTMYIYDVAAGEVITTQAFFYPAEGYQGPLPLATPVLFNEVNSQVAMQASYPGILDWEIAVINYASGEVQTLRPDMMSDLLPEVSPEAGVLVDLLSYDDLVVTFRLIPAMVGDREQTVTYQWNTVDGAIVPVDLPWAAASTFDRSSDGDIIWPEYDEAFPYAVSDDGSMYGAVSYNIIKSYDPVTNTTFTVYNNAEKVIVDVTFIQNGERLLVTLFDPAADARMPQDGISHLVMERDGTVVGESVDIPAVDIVLSTPDGFVYRGTLPSPFISITAAVITRDGNVLVHEPRALATSLPQEPVRSVIHIQSSTSVPTEFVPWADLQP
ncbi:MAG: hypothetical protein HC828_05265 [Blastochloris sp.]|nr:hypothetical protein [Blastochloris sp.]